MASIVTGRKLDQQGKSIDGTGFEYDSGSRLEALLKQKNSPLCSEPVTSEWVFGLVSTAETKGEYERGVGIFSEGNAGPPHIFIRHMMSLLKLFKAVSSSHLGAKIKRRRQAIHSSHPRAPRIPFAVWEESSES
jgi:hypothetical protein